MCNLCYFAIPALQLFLHSLVKCNKTVSEVPGWTEVTYTLKDPSKNYAEPKPQLAVQQTSQSNYSTA